jgi:hypothetical protein
MRIFNVRHIAEARDDVLQPRLPDQRFAGDLVLRVAIRGLHGISDAARRGLIGGVAKHVKRRSEEEFRRIGLHPGRFDQVARAADIDLLGQFRLLIAHWRNDGRQMHDDLLPFDSSLHLVRVADVAPAHFVLVIETLRRPFRARRAHVKRAHVMPLSDQFRSGVTADVAKSSCK